jgi:soluble lytic murein transglycosylase-like protein
VFNSLIQQESGGRAGIRGPRTQYGQPLGKTQMLPETAREMAGKLGLAWRPDLLTSATPEGAAYQERLGRAYFDEGLSKTGNVRDALHYYHGGPNRAMWGPKTRDYANSVIRRTGGR